MGIIVSRRILKEGRHKSVKTDIKDNEDLLTWINENIGGIKYVATTNKLLDVVTPLIESQAKISSKKFKRLIISQNDGIRSQSSTQFWLNRGYEEKVAKEKVAKFQSKGGRAFAEKRKKNPEKYTDVSPTQLNYWINKLGCTYEEAKKLHSDRQSTFTLEKCIEKYGKEEGTKKFNNRQRKWLKSRKEALAAGVWDLKDQGKDFKSWEEKYGDSWMNEFIHYLKKRNAPNLQLYEFIVDHKNDLDKSLLKLNWLEFKDYANLGLTQYLSSKTKIELCEDWCKQNDVKFIKTMYGNLSYKDGKFYQSEGELEIGLFLRDLNLEFEVHKTYENFRYISDFYIPSLDLYVEYMGMSKNTYINKIKELANTYKIIWSSDIEFIKRKINEKIY